VRVTNPNQTMNADVLRRTSEVTGANLRCQEGNNPDRRLRSLTCCAEWRRWWGCTDSQEVGLEAAILERVRNSSLVECPCAENVAGLKQQTEAANDVFFTTHHGRGAFGSSGEAQAGACVERTEVRMPE
jgi:hypothetical protein